MSGWIKLHRNIQDHWIFSEPKYFHWWSIMLLNANHKDKKISIGYNLYTIKKGECAYSIRTWSDKFKCSTKQVNNFFKMLENDSMIEKTVLGTGKQSTTLINISNYSKYQYEEETQGKRKGNASGTQGKREGGTTKETNTSVLVEERKEEKERRAYDFLKSVVPSKIETFEMQNKKQVSEWDRLLENYNDQMDIEVSKDKIDFIEDQLFRRLSQYTRNWISNQVVKNNLSVSKNLPKDPNKVYFYWKHEGKQHIKSVSKTRSTEYFEKQKVGGYIPVILDNYAA